MVSALAEFSVWASFSGYGSYVWGSVLFVVAGLGYTFYRLKAEELRLCRSYLQTWQEEQAWQHSCRLKDEE